MIFSSGWEWGYWLNDVITARAAFDPQLSASSDSAALRAALGPVLRSFGAAAAPLADLLVTIAEDQRDLLIRGEVGGKPPSSIIERNGQAYMQGWESFDDLGSLITPSPDIARIITGLRHEDARIWVLDKHRRVLAQRGWSLSGSDSTATGLADVLPPRTRLRQGHAAAHLPRQLDAVIHSDAILADNPERRAAASRAIPTLTYFDVVGQLMRDRHGLAVAGTHGKSTTTAMAAAVLVDAGLDPTVLCGAATLGRGPLAILFRVEVPLARRGLLSGVVLAFARALGEFGATLLLAGNVSGRTQTLRSRDADTSFRWRRAPCGSS